MSYCEWHDHGYGVELDKLQLREDYPQRLLEKAIGAELIEQDDIFYNLNIKALNEAPYSELEGVIDEYDACNGHWGLGGLLADLLNVKLGSRIFEYADYCLYVPARIPADKKERLAMLTQEQIRKILARELNPLLVESVTVGHVEVCE